MIYKLRNIFIRKCNVCVIENKNTLFIGNTFFRYYSDRNKGYVENKKKDIKTMHGGKVLKKYHKKNYESNFLYDDSIDIQEEKSKFMNKYAFQNKRIFAKKKCIYFFCVKPTLNNVFGYVYNSYSYMKENRTVIRSPLRFTTVSVGMTGYKGPTKLSDIALEETGFLLANRIRKKNIKTVILVLLTRVNRKVRQMLKGFCKRGKIRITRVLLIPKLAHNGCRLKKKKRL